MSEIAAAVRTAREAVEDYKITQRAGEAPTRPEHTQALAVFHEVARELSSEFGESCVLRVPRVLGTSTGYQVVLLQREAGRHRTVGTLGDLHVVVGSSFPATLTWPDGLCMKSAVCMDAEGFRSAVASMLGSTRAAELLSQFE